MKKPKASAPVAAASSVPVEPAAKPLPATTMSLQQIRDSALRQRFDMSKTIAELDALSSEITATLAFLRAQRDGKA
jgi:hypothetical protein